MNIISFLMPTAKSAEAGAKSQAPADVQSGTGFAAMLAQVLGSLGVPVRSDPSAAPVQNGTLEGDGTTESGDDVAGDGATAPVSGEGEVVEEGDLDGDPVAALGRERVAATALEEIRRAMPLPSKSSESAPGSQMQTRLPQDGLVANDPGRADSRVTPLVSQPVMGSLLRDAHEGQAADHRHAGADKLPMSDVSAKPDGVAADARLSVAHGSDTRLMASSAPVRARSALRNDVPSPSSPVLPDHTIESVTSGASTIRQMGATPGTIAEKLMQMIVEPPVDPGSKPIVGRPLSKPQGDAASIPAERTSTDARSNEPNAEPAAPVRGETAAPRVMPMAEQPIARMMTNTPAGTAETTLLREAPEVPQQPDASKGPFESVSLRVNNADGTPTRIRVAVRGDEVRTTIIENDGGAAQRMVSRGDDLQQSLAARGFSKTTLSVQAPMGRAPDIAVAQPMHLDRSDAGSSPDGRADRDEDRASQRDQMHDRPDTDRERSRQRSRQERKGR